ncbi:MAG: UPF0149 family protein [Gammaproteobacteria bacterium]
MSGQNSRRGCDDRVREAEACGTITGAIATGEAAATAARLATAAQEVPEELSAFAVECGDALRAGRFTLPAALADTSLTLALRIEMLAVFTRGFLSGLGQAGERLDAISVDGGEMLRDLETISRGAALESDGRASEEEERAYRQLLEYLRLAPEYFYRALV